MSVFPKNFGTCRHIVIVVQPAQGRSILVNLVCEVWRANPCRECDAQRLGCCKCRVTEHRVEWEVVFF